MNKIKVLNMLRVVFFLTFIFFIIFISWKLITLQYYSGFVRVIFNLYFNWRKIGLPCSIGFCVGTTMQISHNYTYITLLLSCPPLPLSHCCRSSQGTQLGFLCYIAASHQLSILNMVMYMFHCYSLNCPTLSFPHCLHQSVLYV